MYPFVENTQTQSTKIANNQIKSKLLHSLRFKMKKLTTDERKYAKEIRKAAQKLFGLMGCRGGSRYVEGGIPRYSFSKMYHNHSRSQRFQILICQEILRFQDAPKLLKISRFHRFMFLISQDLLGFTWIPRSSEII